MNKTFLRVLEIYKLNAIPFEIHQDDHLVNNMAVAGNEVSLGKYDNDEYELISLFHEIGHTLIDFKFQEGWNYNTLITEIKCWELGIEEAKKNGILFSDDAIQWGYSKAMSYVGNDEKQHRGWFESSGKKLWINKEEA